ncbi:SET and MYND domain-containing protein 4-like isoform X2 [Zerene cesonia]|uniref:SET and MYND domain-containing protein 4-like isoform X2 n=1 Tax=Zerene cesonia TaxID=33412 RepID=UPI0018E55F47|nr:SET and MYND domain-containing protein 4-like isoform X2 [Zerene cesonia]
MSIRIDKKMLSRGMLYHKSIDQSKIERIYNAMASDDLADVVMTTLNILEESGGSIEHPSNGKLELESDGLRTIGNDFFNKGDYHASLQCYNKALCHAPKDGRAIKLAYSNRSALFLKTKCYIDCIKDIDRCFALGCPADIEKKLIKRKKEANYHVPSEFYKMKCKDYFKIKSPCDTILPSISSQIKIEINDEYELKLTAVEEIKSGMVLAHETAYVTSIHPEDIYSACYYCLKITPCLLPCDTCCYCMFCSETCKIKCFDEYHDIECKFIENFSFRPVSLLIIKTILKLFKKVNSWPELIAASKLLGTERIKNSSLKELLNPDSLFSILSFPDNKPFVYGPMYNSCFECAEIINCLSEFPHFYPSKNTSEYIEAKRALARIMMHLHIFGMPSTVIQSVYVQNKNKLTLKASAAFYTCFGKMKVSCNSNAEIHYLNNKAVLIAKHKINPGEEVIVSGLNGPQNSDQSQQGNRQKLFQAKKYVCSCPTCFGTAERLTTLSDKQKQFYRQFNIIRLTNTCDHNRAPKFYDEAKKIMDVLNDVPFSDEYIETFNLFYKCLVILTNATTDNTIIA